MLFIPGKAAEGFGLISPETHLLFRWLGGMILCSGILNLLVRNHADFKTLKAVFIFNILFHAITMFTGFLAAFQGIVEFNKIIPGTIVHLFIGIGSTIYLVKIKTLNASAQI